jgi:hypothetical protein
LSPTPIATALRFGFGACNAPRNNVGIGDVAGSARAEKLDEHRPVGELPQQHFAF